MHKEIFVFGSNLAGRHGKGAALCAVKNHGAIYGQGVGPMGNAYAIPTKDRWIRTMSLADIEPYVEEFKKYVKQHPEQTFKLTAVGTGLAGYSHADMLNLFFDLYTQPNVLWPMEWAKMLPVQVACH